ncbi:MAG: hypothetical protein HY040_08640 [Planctomycetes bacterium]|nr:hypothetical protein [Planctomycetota bacterium]
MGRKRKIWWTSLGCAAVLGALLAFGLLIKHEPSFYRRAAVGQGQDRVKLSNEFVGNMAKLHVFWKEGKGGWEIGFSEAQINSYFHEGFLRFGEAETLRKHGISEPCVSFEQDHFRLAFRYGTGLWSTVVSYDLKLWLAPKEMNVVMIEIQGHHAGGLPISSQSLLNEISEVARRSNLDVAWYRNNGNPVAMVRFLQEQARPSAKLTGLDTRPGLLVLKGNSNEPQTLAEPRALTPSGN